MSRTQFFRYLTSLPRDEVWGVVVTAGGRYASTPDSPYPPPGHPAGHRFDWSNGRVLGCYQILHLVAGSGWFETRKAGLVPVRAGQLLLLFPGTWHRYKPDEKGGWTEEWIELRGPQLRRLEEEGILSQGHSVLSVSGHSEIGTLFHKILESVRDGGPRPDPTTSGMALELIAVLHAERSRQASPRSSSSLIAKAEERMNSDLGSPLDLEALARDLGIAYSHFRREFKTTTGLSPARYFRLLRLEKARRLLGATGSPIKKIAEEVGFSSEFHLSAAFKKEFGVSPGIWRMHRRAPKPSRPSSR